MTGVGEEGLGAPRELFTAPNREGHLRLPTSPAPRPAPSNAKGRFEGRKLEPLTPLQPSSQLPCRALLVSPGPGLTSPDRSAAERQSRCTALSCAAPGEEARSRPPAAPGLGAGSARARPRRALRAPAPLGLLQPLSRDSHSAPRAIPLALARRKAPVVVAVPPPTTHPAPHHLAGAVQGARSSAMPCSGCR